MAFVAGFAMGPGVCVWLCLTELMPTRIRSLGMGIGLLINQGISTAIAAAFLPVAREWGYAVVFLVWAVCTAGYFLIAALVLPETKGRSLEEIEAEFARSS
jgi:SP family myo-inositol transporter-like MFS transporter 13